MRLFYAKSDQKLLNQTKIHEKRGLPKQSNRRRNLGRGNRSFNNGVFQQNLPTRDPWLENLSVRFLKSRNNGKLPPDADFRDVVSQTYYIYPLRVTIGGRAHE